ncbi:MAG: hypothetical protein R2747_01600 [Pyrinomonadaceae bacterium]
MKKSWGFGILAGMIIALYGLYPQFAVISERGPDYNGVFASNDLDEPAYAAYLQALIDGRSRLNDPYTGRDSTPENPQPESIFSIQFAAPYAVGIPARLLGLNAAQTFTALSALAGFLTALALFWLIVQITGEARFAGIAVLLILLGGALASGNGFINELLGRGGAYPFLPFLRRYIPAVAFPFFFAVFGFLWLALKSEVGWKKYLSSVLSGLCFAFTVFSYYYLWTTAAAFLFALTLLWLIIRPENWKRDLRYLLLADGVAFLFLIPYGHLLSGRSQDIDSVQMLALTHAPDLFRVPAVICYVVLLLIGLAVRLGYARLKCVSTVFLLAFSIVPLIVFNQQVITGRSLQPFHYEFYVVNYVTALTVVLVLFLFLKQIQGRRFYAPILLILGLAAVVWGFFEVRSTTRLLMFWNVIRDEAWPVSERLVELAREDRKNGQGAVTLNFDYIQADNQTTIAPQAVLWARHLHVFAGADREENKERFFQLIYYSGRDADWLREDIERGDIEAIMALFSWDRFNPRLSVNARPLTAGEVEEEVRRYRLYCENFTYRQASAPALSFLVKPSGKEIDLTNLERWYELGPGESFGKYTLYKLTLKPAQPDQREGSETDR